MARKRRNKKIEAIKVFLQIFIVVSVFVTISYSIVLRYTSPKSSSDNSSQSTNSTTPENPEPSELIQLNSAGFEREINSDFVCLNNNSLLVSNWEDPNFVSAVNRLKPTRIRTGGSEANYFDWQRGGLFTQEKNGINIPFPAEILTIESAKPPSLAQFFRQTETKPVWMLNMLTDTLESQIARLKDAQTRGMDVSFIELGHELYTGTTSSTDGNRKVYPEAINYALEAKRWSEQLNIAFPQAKIAYIVQTGVTNQNPALANWNTTVSEQLSQNEVYSIHVYSPNGLEDGQDTKSDWQKVLATAKATWSSTLKDLPSGSEKKKIWITEYNVFESAQGLETLGKWVNGLHTLSLNFEFLSNENVEMTCQHVLYGNSQWAAIYGPQSALERKWQQDFVQNNLSSSGYTLSYLSRAIEGSNKASKLSFTSMTKADGSNSLDKALENIQGWEFSGESGKKLLILNATDSVQKLQVDSIFPNGSRRFQISATPETIVGNPRSIQNDTKVISKELELTPFSVTLVTPQ